MDRLTFRSGTGEASLKQPYYAGYWEAVQKLAEYEDAEEQRLLMRLPCKVGSTVFVIRTEAKTGNKSIHEGKVINFSGGGDFVVIIAVYSCRGIEEQGYFKWGLNAFSSRAEACEALLGNQSNN